ncbi:MAG: hypothetical protein HZA31_06820 [Opitutae bacterium]|nr:hypothetical protein [Opitutae bacterium]
MNWTELDWPALDRLRDKFLSGSAAGGPYWQSPADLANYDLTYGARIGWKWDAVLRELKLRGWTPPLGRVLDWGCGSGVAIRRVLAALGAERCGELLVWDHSPLAADFAAATAEKAFPGLRVSTVTPGFLAGNTPLDLLLVSHVLNELSTEALAELRGLILRSSAVLWVEPGTHEVARGLQTIRDELRAEFRLIAPCTHQGACGLLAPERTRDWCHFFAPPPSEIFANPDWVKFGQRAGVDLRSLPYCFVALERKTAASAAPADTGLSRVIGRPEHFKPYARLLNCDATGVAELTLPKRAAPALYKELDRSKAPLVYRWQRDGNVISQGSSLSAAAP